jgi:heme/copper-type cytochrome/quinol oxidase subunit 2
MQIHNTQLNNTFTTEDILRIAKDQKNIMWLILVSFITIVIPFAFIITGIISTIFIYRLANSIGSSDAWLYVVLSLIPLVGLITLAVASSKATKILKSRGIRVGLMGAKSNDLKNFSLKNV